MKIIALCAGLLIALSAGASGNGLRAKLVGQRIVSSYPGAPILVCQYAAPEARYEVVASGGTCAPYLALD